MTLGGYLGLATIEVNAYAADLGVLDLVTSRKGSPCRKLGVLMMRRYKPVSRIDSASLLRTT